MLFECEVKGLEEGRWVGMRLEHLTEGRLLLAQKVANAHEVEVRADEEQDPLRRGRLFDARPQRPAKVVEPCVVRLGGAALHLHVLKHLSYRSRKG